MQKHHAAIGSYHFKRAKTDGVIQVLNEGSYLMAEYAEKTGSISWQRVVLASQREAIERWLREHYPKPEPMVQAKENKDAKRSMTKPVSKPIAKPPVGKSMAKTASARA
jgi:hypothetical protein